jgi:hypothetical protein
VCNTDTEEEQNKLLHKRTAENEDYITERNSAESNIQESHSEASDRFVNRIVAVTKTNQQCRTDNSEAA